MKNIIYSFKKSYTILVKDKVVLVFSMAPILIGLVLYYFLGAWLFQDVLTWGEELVAGKISSEGVGSFLYWIMATILSIAIFLLLNYTFVLTISLLASPFNDLISSRVEKAIRGQSVDSMSESFKLILKRISRTVFNEIKKLVVIGFLTIIAISLSFFPLLVPISILVSCLLLAASFLDYSWSRHNLPFRSCLNDMRKSFFTYGLAGGIFLFLFSIPIINLFVLPYAVVYFTVLFSSKKIIADESFK